MKLNLTGLFGKSDRKRVKLAFRAVRNDMQSLEEGHFALKHSADEWIRFLSEKNSELAQRVEALERHIASQESVSDEHELSILREI